MQTLTLSALANPKNNITFYPLARVPDSTRAFYIPFQKSISYNISNFDLENKIINERMLYHAARFSLQLSRGSQR